MQRPDVRIERHNLPLLSTRARRISSIIIPTTGEMPSYLLDALQIAHESIQEGFSVEGTNALMAEVQLIAVSKAIVSEE